MQKLFFSLIILGSAICGFSQTNSSLKTDTTANVATIDFALLDRIVSQHDFDNTTRQNNNQQYTQDESERQMNTMTNHRMLNNAFRVCARRLKMVTGQNRNYLINFFNQVLQFANHSILADGSNQERFMHILHDTEEAITYVLRYPSIDLEQEYAAGKSKLAPLIVN